ncbi:MAG: zinc-binding dehydrogenase, partial [Minicystis sp.]
MRARALWFESPGVAALREEELAEPGPGEVRVRAICSGISAGTERLVLRGEVPIEAQTLMHLPAMRGTFALPLCYGYALVGTVESLGPGVDPARLGERVFLLHPHQDRLIAPASALLPLPASAPPARLVLAPNLETAINAVWDAGVTLGDRVLVSGLGVVGLLIAWLCMRAGASAVVGVDPDEPRRDLARSLGISRAIPTALPEEIAPADILIEASSVPAALSTLVEHAGPEVRLTVVSWYGGAAVPLPLGGRFHPHRLTIRGSQVG